MFETAAIPRRSEALEFGVEAVHVVLLPVPSTQDAIGCILGAVGGYEAAFSSCPHAKALIVHAFIARPGLLWGPGRGNSEEMNGA